MERKTNLLALVAGALPALFLVWAALHDISQGAEQDYTLEWVALGLGVVALAALYRVALAVLAGRARMTWLAVAAGVMFLLNASALSAAVHPKYANDAAVGAAFLCVGMPILGVIGYNLVSGLKSRAG